MNGIQILPNIFPEDIPVDYHHVDGYCFVVPIPKKIHNKTKSGSDNTKHIEKTNEWIEFYYSINPNDFLKEMDEIQTKERIIDIKTLLQSIQRKTQKVIHTEKWWKENLIECKQCNNLWIPRKQKRSVVCPSCQSPYWDQERREKKPDVKKESA